MVSRPKIGISNSNQRAVAIQKSREAQRRNERAKEMEKLQQEFDREGLTFQTSVPLDDPKKIERDLRQQLEQKRFSDKWQGQTGAAERALSEQNRLEDPDEENVRLLKLAQEAGVTSFPLMGSATSVEEANDAIRAAISTRLRLQQYPNALARREAETATPGRAALTGLRTFGAVVDPFGEILAQGGAQVGGERFGTAGAVAGGLLGGAIAPVPRLRPGAGGIPRPGLGTLPVVEGATQAPVRNAASAVVRQFKPTKEPGIVGDLPVVNKLVSVINEARPLRGNVEARRSFELGQRVKAGARELGQGEDVERAFGRAKAQLGGELPKGSFEIPEGAISADEVVDLRNLIRNSDEQFLTKINLDETLAKVLGGEVPARGEIDNLARFFGDDLAKAVLKKRSKGQKAWEEFVDAINLPRTMLASFGIDAFRQGAPLIAAHPKVSFRAFNAAWKAARRDSVARSIRNGLMRDPDVALLQQYGLNITNFGGTASQIAREEGFVSRWGQIFPWTRISERANSTFFNVQRAEVGKGILREWRDADNIARAMGREANHMTPENLQELANFINIATGRGNLGKFQQYSPALNAVFFSPRLIASRFELPFTALTRSPAVRKQVARDLSIFVATNIGILAFLKAAGGDKVDVELDPRSSDFGQLKIGAQRVDFWGGMRQIAVLAARLASGETKSTGTETVLTQPQKDTLLQFFRFKLSPQASALTDYVTGETALGEELGVDNQVADRFFPLVVEDMKDAFEEQGIGGAAVSSFSLVGLNSNTYLTTQDIVNPLLETRINVEAQDGSGRITDITDKRLTPAQRSQILSRPDVQQALLMESRRTKQDQLQVERNARRTQRLTNDYRLATGEMDARTWRNSLLTSRLVSAAVAETRESLTSARPKTDPRNDNERALNRYFDLVDAHKVEAANIDYSTYDPALLTPEQREQLARGFDVDGFSVAIDQYLGSLSDEQREYVLNNIHPDRTPVENLYYRAQDILEDYWNVPEQVIKDPQLLALYDQWQSMAPNARKKFQRRNPAVERAVRRVNSIRERMRKGNREIDDMLIAFYGGSPTHRVNIRESRDGFLTSRIRERIFGKAEEILERQTGVSSTR